MGCQYVGDCYNIYRATESYFAILHGYHMRQKKTSWNLPFPRCIRWRRNLMKREAGKSTSKLHPMRLDAVYPLVPLLIQVECRILKSAIMIRRRSGHYADIGYVAGMGLKCWSTLTTLVIVQCNYSQIGKKDFQNTKVSACRNFGLPSANR